MCHPEVPEGELSPPIATDEVRVGLTDGDLPALLAHPGAASLGAVLLLHDIHGRSPFYDHLAARLATAGFTVLLPDFFYREGPLPEPTREAAFARRAAVDSRRLLRDALGAARWLRQDPGLRVGTLGFCMGGTYGLAMAAEDGLLATVCYYGFPGGPVHPDQSDGPTLIDLVPQIAGPVIGFWGEEDAGVGIDNVERFARAMEARGADFEYEVYPGAGHGFMATSGLDPENRVYRQACDSWTRAISFLRSNVG